MTAIRTEIVEAVMQRLRALPDACETELMPSADPISFPARHVFDSGQAVVEGEAGSTQYQLALSVEGYLERADGAVALAALNELYAATVAAVTADETLGGLSETIDEGDYRIMVAPLASKPRLGFSLDFTIQFATRRGNPADIA